MQRQFSLDRLVGRLILILFLASMVLFTVELGPVSLAWLVLGACLALGLSGTLRSRRTWEALTRITAMIEAGDPRAEEELAGLMTWRPLQRVVRLLLYHRLGLLRFQQGRWAETAAVCWALLQQPLGPLGGMRVPLLLMAAESSLNQGDLAGAWRALATLNREPLGLVASLQRLGLQTRYEDAAGYHELTVRDLGARIRFAEMMPPPQCAAMHGLLTVAAHRCGRADEAAWLWHRCELLCPPAMLEDLARVLRGEPAAQTGTAAVPLA